MQPKPKTHLTPNEYLAIERKANFKSEYYNGEMFALAGASYEHNSITSNLLGDLISKLKGKPCKVFGSDLRIKVRKSAFYSYPDISIICGEPEFDDDAVRDTVNNPRIIMEVLSKSTEDYDRGQKFVFYRQIESLREYILVSQDQIFVEQFIRNEKNEWLLKEYKKKNDAMKLESIDVFLNLHDIYSGIDLNE